MSEARRRRLAELAAERGLLVLEDDPYGLVRYDGDALPSVFELSGGATAYCSSFSKTIAPGLRVGWYVLPQPLAADLEALATSTYISPPYLSQATVLEFLTRGSFAPNLERVNGLLRARRDAMLAALEREMPDDATWTQPDGGYFVWLDLPSGPPSAELLARAEAAGVSFVQGSDFFPAARAASSRCGSRSASSRRTRSQTASRGWRRWCDLRRLRRSSAASSSPPTSPTASERRISQISDTFVVPKTKCTETELSVLEDERDRVGDQERQEDEPDVEQPALVDVRTAQVAHACDSNARLCGGLRARHEPRLLRRHEGAA